DDADALRIGVIAIEPRVAQTQAGRSDREAHRPAHDLHVLTLIGRDKGRQVEVGHLGGDFHGVIGGVEAADGTNAAGAVQASGPERILADSIGGYHAQASHDHSAHAREPLRRTQLEGNRHPPWSKVQPAALARQASNARSVRVDYTNYRSKTRLP